ncbi:MAG: SDR family NAD(P)-dependent oxidoreductase [Hyphomonadaceae bacterium]|nr:SDR family NAD(P)-dependent oxidoreductase [Hyphomonadaceae bacterium]
MAIERSFLVTGAYTGIGRAAVAVGVARGAHVYASVRKSADADDLSRAFGAKVTPLVFDVVDEAGVAAAATAVAAAQKGRRLTGVVNNAGAAVPGPLLHMSAAELRQQMEVNLIGVHNVTRAFAPLLGAEGTQSLGDGPPGRIVMISSVAGRRSLPFLAAYAASKFALEGYAEGLRRELMPFRVDVVVIGPGAVKTAIWDKGLSLDRARYADSVYAPVLDVFTAEVGKQAAAGLRAEVVGALIWHALSAPAPKPRYAILRNALSGWMLPNLLPTRTLDRAIASRFGLAPRR